MFINNRVIYSDNAVLTDISALLSDPYDGEKAFVWVAAQDALYIGSDLPFNNRFFMAKKKNTIAGTVSVAIWTGEEFTAAEDVQDFTSVDGIPFSRSGMIRFALPANVGWSSVYDSTDITELDDVTVKAKFWAKLTFSAAFDFELEYLGFRFARDADLNTYYKDLLTERSKTAFNGGVSMPNWDKVFVMAAEEVISALRKRELIWSGNQILDPEQFTAASCHKLAEMAYGPGALNQPDKVEFAQAKYREAMSLLTFGVDKNMNGRLDLDENKATGRLMRV